METFVVNETSEDVWFDNLIVASMTNPVAQETHYDPWGLELTGIGYQYGGIKANKYLYNGNEILSDLSLDLYDFKSRFYDPAIGRFISIDVLADHPKQIGISPYQFSWNNPIRYNDPNGECPCWSSLIGAYQAVKVKYTGLVAQAIAPAQRLISGTSGSVPSNIGMGDGMRAAIKVAGVSSDINAVADVGVNLAQESLTDVGGGLEQAGETISLGGLASTPLTGPLGLTIMKAGDGVSAVGSSAKAIGYTIGGDYNSAGAEFAKAGVSVVTGKAVGTAVDYSKAVGNAAKDDVLQESILQTLDKGVTKISNYIIDFFKEEKER
jgi:RHS repeat-associated protein